MTGDWVVFQDTRIIFDDTKIIRTLPRRWSSATKSIHLIQWEFLAFYVEYMET